MDDSMDETGTMLEATRQHAIYGGSKNPERAWISTQFDTWEPNPFYTGPAVPHPEEEVHDDE